MTQTNTRTLTVRYAGGVARRGPVTMGQANMIRCILRDGAANVSIHDVWPVPAGTTREQALDALRQLVERHEALRTTFPGTVPREQVVAAEGEFPVAVLDHDEPGPDPTQYAESVARRARDHDFRLDQDFPLRLSLLTVGGAPTHLALAASHAATDGGALGILREEWLTLLSGGELPAPTALTPLGLAAEEATPAGRRRSEASLAYWERIIRTAPQAMFAEPRAEAADGLAPQLTLRSRRGALALARAADRTGGLPSTVLITAWCTLVGHRAGQTTCVAAVPTSNRFQPRLARSVNTLSQDALLALDLRIPSFDALLRKAWGAALNAYRHSQFDALRLWEMIDRATVERGSHFARDVVFNDVSALPATLGPKAPPGAPDPDLELSWGPVQALPTKLLAFTFQTEPLLHIGMWADPALFDRDEAEGFLTGLVRLLEAVADADVPLTGLTAVTGVRPTERGAGWRQVDGCWVSPPTVADALATALGGLPVHVTVDDPEGLTAFIASGGTPLTPHRAHTALMAAIPGRPGVLAPRRYVIVQDPPADPGRADAWHRQQTLTEGTGRTPADVT
ncbi:condensation domain-containing protein [Kitasatospora sp. NPDC085879]|uniref:condensation domain-containing protein n=1 Tax=Kitasatospora sp. NPDC085879 TaxID=3154769 RepID=UPI00343B2206